MTELFPVQGGYVEWDPISELRHLARSVPVILDGCPSGTPESAIAAARSFGEVADGSPEELRERGQAVVDAFSQSCSCKAAERQPERLCKHSLATVLYESLSTMDTPPPAPSAPLSDTEVAALFARFKD